jgi:hypothetical protein
MHKATHVSLRDFSPGEYFMPSIMAELIDVFASCTFGSSHLRSLTPVDTHIVEQYSAGVRPINPNAKKRRPPHGDFR